MNDLVWWISAGATVLAITSALFWWAVKTRIENRRLRAEHEDLRSRLRQRGERFENQADQLEVLRAGLAQTRAERDGLVAKARRLAAAQRALEKRRRQALAKARALAAERQQWEGAAREGARRVVAAETERDQAREQLAHFENQNETFSRRIQELEQQVDGLVASDGALWQRPIASAAPRFRPLDQRRFPIISVLNLKGGVGKTTITAHLAGWLGQHGKNVLVVDLDFQRSLSQMLLTPERRRILHLERRCLQHFLAGKQHGFGQVVSCAQPVGAGMANCWIIANSDPAELREGEESLEAVETRLLADWVLRRGTPDVRLLLREGLHAAEAGHSFDYVLFDCPPRLTAACINALAASDFVLIPVILDAMTARAVPHLLNALKRLKGDLLPELDVLGIVANLVTLRKGEPTQAEQSVRGDLKQKLTAIWGKDVPFFETAIPDKSELAEAARSLEHGRLELALWDETVRERFADLAAEIDQEIAKHERRNAATVSS